MRRQIVIFRMRRLIKPEEFEKIRAEIREQYYKDGLVVVPEDIEVTLAQIGDDDGETLLPILCSTDEHGNLLRGLTP